jgi:light-regulated signal transduction histidine kinase (bacteriophytochrome)
VTGAIARGAGRDQAVDPGSYAKAILNILADFSDEKARLAVVQKANLNILEDFAGEKVWLEATQRATLNILEDFSTETQKVEQTNREMATEIAERKRAEEALLMAKAATDAANRGLELVNKELEAFSYSVSHDLRAPLRSIDGFSQALIEDYADRLDDQARDYLNRVRAATQRMGHLIDDMLALARVTRTEMRRESVDLSALAGDVLAELQKSEPDRRVESHIEPGLVAQGDTPLLRVVLVNLLGNAWKFTGKQAHARIEFGTHPQKTGEPAYFVRDNGAGFDMTYAGKLFGAFQRLHSPHEFPGTGVGLATVQRVVHRHGGRVWTEGAVGKGATFYFTLRPDH